MRKLYFLIFYFFFVSTVFSQSAITDPKVSLNLDSATIATVIEKIESQSNYTFFYKNSQVDTMRFSFNAENISLTNALAHLFDDRGIKYTYHSNNSIFLTLDRQIITELPIHFFVEEKSFLVEEESEIPDFLQEDETSKIQSNNENKLIEIGKRSGNGLEGTANIAGHVRDMDNGEPVIGAVIYIEEPRIGVATDQFGYYSITLPKGRHELNITTIGMKDTKRQIMLFSNGKLNIELKEDVIPLREIIVESEKDQNIVGLSMGVEKLDINELKQVPTAFGETDVLRIALTLPGVQTVGESTTGLNVRGGTTDQNLILYNDATIYNPSHLFGFFSAFNPDVLKNVELYKSGIPAEYGGRLSSILEITNREGNKKKFTGSGGIGSLTTRLTLEGPIIKDKLTLTLSGRTTYSDWLLGLIPEESIKNSQASFYDLNAQINYEINEKNSLFITGYYSDDKFKLNSDTLYNYNNQAATIKWKHIFNNKLYGVLTGSYSGYNYNVESEQNPVNAFKLDYDLNQINFKFDLNYFPNSTHNFDIGLSSIYYSMFPGNNEPLGSESLVVPIDIQQEKGLESAVYVGDKIELSDRSSLYVGLRYSFYQSLGPRDIFVYPDDSPKEVENIIDTAHYDNGIINTYHGPELRASYRYLLPNHASIKLSYNRMRQYIHMLSNTTAISPTDIWKLSDPNIKPQVGDQISVGYYKNFRASAIETSIEGYYKISKNILDYKSGAQLILNDHIETDIIGTEGKAYGVEFMVKKPKGKINGWMSYTYSRTFQRTTGQDLSEIINSNQYYPSNFDKPHDFTLIGNYRFNKRVNMGLNFIYSTGRPITLPLTKYSFEDSKRIHYSDRNQFRIPDYIRLDYSINVEGNHKVRKLAHSSWTFAVYNLLGRRNPYSVYFVTQDGEVIGYKLSIFGNPIPTITYNFKF